MHRVDASRAKTDSAGFFGVVSSTQSYLNLLYLLISFPLGVFYFAFLMTGIALSLGLAIIVIGLFVLIFVLAATRALGAWERSLSCRMLGAEMPCAPRIPVTWRRPLHALELAFMDAETWKSFAFLLLKLPLGIVSIAIVVAFAATSISFLASALAFSFAPETFMIWHVESVYLALIMLALGLLLIILSLHVFNGMAVVWRALAVALLHPRGAVSQATPATARPIVIP